MANKWKKVATFAVTAVIAASACSALAACGGDKGSGKGYTYRVATTQLPTSWNVHTYQENQSTLILNYTEDGFYTFDYNETKDGYKIVPAMASEMPQDVTATYKNESKWGIDANDSWKAIRVELRHDLKFDNGAAIKAQDFVESVKLLLDPDAVNYRADSLYGGQFSIVGAKSYAYSDRTAYIDSMDIYDEYDSTSDEFDSELTFSFFWSNKDNATTDATKMVMDNGYNTLRVGLQLFGFQSVFAPDAATPKDAVDQTEAIFNSLNGKTLAQIKADDTLKGYWETLCEIWPQKDDDEMLQFLLGQQSFDHYDWENVGIVAVDDYTLDFVLEKSLSGFYLTYNLTSAMSLVNTNLYKKCTSTSQGVYTNNYGTSKSTYIGFGPYRISSFISGSKVTFEKNPYWYGYNDEENKDLYQTTNISIQQIATDETRLQEFLAGNLDSYGMRADDMATYQSSDYTYYTEGDSTWFVALNPDYNGLLTSQQAATPSVAGRTVNKTVLTIKEFRQALSFSIDRAAWQLALDPLGSTAKALYSNMIISDPENGVAYRTTDEAKETILNFWGLADKVGAGKEYATVDEAIDSITGYDPAGAKELFQTAYDKAVENHYIDPDSDWEVQLMFGMSGSSATSDYNTKGFDVFSKAWTEAVKGTPFEGRLVFTKSGALNNDYANVLRANGCDILFGVGWTGEALDPYSLMEAYVAPNYQYDPAWDTSAETLDITLNIDGEDKTLRASVYAWGKEALQGETITATVVVDSEATSEEVEISAGVAADMSLRLKILAAVENAVLGRYDMLPLTTEASANLKGMRIQYYTEEYIFGVGRGGIKYMTYTMNDAEWSKFVKAQGGTLNYA